MVRLSSRADIAYRIADYFLWYRGGNRRVRQLLQAGRAPNVLNVSIALAGGLIGAWAGWSVGDLIYPEGVYNPAAPIRTPPFVVSVVLASAGTNILSWSFYTYRLFRYREI